MNDRLGAALCAAGAIALLAACAGGPGARSTGPGAGAVTAVHANQLGFHPASAKGATVVTQADAPLDWRVVDADGRVAAAGMSEPFGLNAASAQAVHKVDMSALKEPGEGYRLRVAGVESAPFAVAAGLYRPMAFDALAFFYHQRSGIPIEARYVGEEWARPAGHAPDRATCAGPSDHRGNVWGGCPYTLDVTGGWYDAADHGKYVVNGGIAVWTLLNYYERRLARPSGAGAFADGTLAIPEQANAVPDLLDEVRWQLEVLMAMQVPEGTALTLPRGDQTDRLDALDFEAVDASGMVHHKMHDENWTDLPTPPHLDAETRFLSYPSTAATLNLAAVAAQCARLWRAIDPDFAAACLAAAERAYEAAKRVPDVLAYDVLAGGGGPYDDVRLEDEFYWAAAELFITTGAPRYEAALRASPLFLFAPQGAVEDDIFWRNVGALGTLSLLTAPNGLPDADKEAARAAVRAGADLYLAETEGEGYGVPFARPYAWGSNSDMANRGLILAAAYDMTGDRAYRDGVVAIMDYLLGRNPLAQSYVTGYGANPVEQPHHRFWAKVLDPSLPGPPPGALSGGPNKEAPIDPVAARLAETCAPQTCFADHVDAYALNEVTINWNAPLFWLAAFLSEE
ncbi:MAG: glycoside hydrolase family 9 protein [Caulobacterales bacterium]|nr:glycoside hydrolase family 9 protein [Caulobacterales bacterium]